MSTPFSQDAIDNDIRAIQTLLERRQSHFRFSPALEAAFRQHTQGRVLELLAQGWWVVLLFYLLVGIATYLQVQMLSQPRFRDANLDVWWTIYLSEGAAIATLILLPRLALLHGHLRLGIGLLAIVSLTAITVGTSAFPDPYFNQHSSYVVIFVLAIIYGLGALSVGPALLACGGAGLLSGLVIWLFDLWLDPGLFLQYVVTANLVGVVLCYMVEQRDRRVFLQERLLRLEKQRLDELSGELSRLSCEDVLTGLANRRHFNDVLQTEWERGRREQRPVALLFVDLDHFKPYNDSYGHLEGDAVLAEVGRTLRGCLRRPGDVAARYGGEEFVLLLPGTHLGGALEVARQIQAALQARAIPHRASGVADRVTASIGVASLVPSQGVRSTQLLAAADEAAYAAKSAGRNCVRAAEGYEAPAGAA